MSPGPSTFEQARGNSLCGPRSLYHPWNPGWGITRKRKPGGPVNNRPVSAGWQIRWNLMNDVRWMPRDGGLSPAPHTAWQKACICSGTPRPQNPTHSRDAELSFVIPELSASPWLFCAGGVCLHCPLTFPHSCSTRWLILANQEGMTALLCLLWDFSRNLKEVS